VDLQRAVDDGCDVHAPITIHVDDVREKPIVVIAIGNFVASDPSVGERADGNAQVSWFKSAITRQQNPNGSARRVGGRRSTAAPVVNEQDVVPSITVVIVDANARVSQVDPFRAARKPNLIIHGDERMPKEREWIPFLESVTCVLDRSHTTSRPTV
jgi:hypothetical protein